MTPIPPASPSAVFARILVRSMVTEFAAVVLTIPTPPAAAPVALLLVIIESTILKFASTDAIPPATGAELRENGTDKIGLALGRSRSALQWR